MVWNFCNHSTDVQSTASTEILQTFPMTNLINMCSFWEYRHSPWRYYSRGHRILCWIEIGLKLVEKDGFEFSFLQHWSYQSTITEKLQNLHILIPPFMFVLRKSTFAMTALISCTSNTMLDRNRPSIGGDRWFGIFVSTALANDQSTSTVNLHILMSPLINICPFWEYRHSKWQHWSFVHRILWLIKIGFKLLVGERRFGILVFTALITSIRKFYSSWCLHWSIYVHSENIDIVHDNFDLLYIEYFAW